MKPRHSAAGALAALAVVLAIAVPAAPAWAHSKLQSTTPAANATVTAAVTTVTLTFNEPVKQQNTTIAVNGPDGVSYSDGAAQRVDNTVSQAIKPLPTGIITVVWKTVSADGDPVNGQFTFTNAAAPPTSAAPSPSDPAPPTTAAAAAPTSVDAQPTASDSGAGTAMWWILGVFVVLLLIAGGALWFRRRGASAG